MSTVFVKGVMTELPGNQRRSTNTDRGDSHRHSLIHHANQVKPIHIGILGRHQLLEDAQQSLYLVVFGDHFGSTQNQRFP